MNYLEYFPDWTKWSSMIIWNAGVDKWSVWLLESKYSGNATVFASLKVLLWNQITVFNDISQLLSSVEFCFKMYLDWYKNGKLNLLISSICLAQMKETPLFFIWWLRNYALRDIHSGWLYLNKHKTPRRSGGIKYFWLISESKGVDWETFQNYLSWKCALK